MNSSPARTSSRKRFWKPPAASLPISTRKAIPPGATTAVANSPTWSKFGSRSRQKALPRRVCQRAAALRFAGQPGGLFRSTHPRRVIMGLDLDHGGHVTSRHKLNFSGKTYHVVSYQTRKEDGPHRFREHGAPRRRTQAQNDRRRRQRPYSRTWDSTFPRALAIP